MKDTHYTPVMSLFEYMEQIYLEHTEPNNYDPKFLGTETELNIYDKDMYL